MPRHNKINNNLQTFSISYLIQSELEKRNHLMHIVLSQLHNDAHQSSIVFVIVESYHKSDITCTVIVSVISAGGEGPRDAKRLPG